MSDLSPNTATAEAAVMAILRRASRAGRAWHGCSELAAELRLDRRLVDRALRRLATDGEAERSLQEIDHKLVAGWRAMSVYARPEP